MDNGAEGMGESIQVDTSSDAVFVGGAPIASAEEMGRPTELLLKRVGSVKTRAPRLQNLAEMEVRPFSGFPGRERSQLRDRKRLIRPFTLLGDEFEDSSGEDTSKDADLHEVDYDLQGLLPSYDREVGTVNFGSRGMTDKRNDFLEGTSGSSMGGPATSATGSTRGHGSATMRDGKRLMRQFTLLATNSKTRAVRTRPRMLICIQLRLRRVRQTDMFRSSLGLSLLATE